MTKYTPNDHIQTKTSHKMTAQLKNDLKETRGEQRYVLKWQKMTPNNWKINTKLPQTVCWPHLQPFCVPFSLGVQNKRCRETLYVSVSRGLFSYYWSMGGSMTGVNMYSMIGSENNIYMYIQYIHVLNLQQQEMCQPSVQCLILRGKNGHSCINEGRSIYELILKRLVEKKLFSSQNKLHVLFCISCRSHSLNTDSTWHCDLHLLGLVLGSLSCGSSTNEL